jgi:hypothetical protein
LFLSKTAPSPGTAIPVKAISKALSGCGLIFEGLNKLLFGRNETFCQGFRGRNPQRSARCNVRRNSSEISPFEEQPSRLGQKPTRTGLRLRP